RALDRKVIVLFTDSRTIDDAARTSIAALQKDAITLIVVVPGHEAASAFPDLPVFALDGRDALPWLEGTLDNLHRW
ncbi:MAG: hypothetical protein ABI175_12810, partial [Polyangiales bacterium]